MANEINLQMNLTVSNGGFTHPVQFSGLFAQSTQLAASGIISTTTAAANIDVGAVTTLGWLYLRNLDANQSVDFGLAGFTAVGTLKPGECALLRLKQGVTPALKAQAGTPRVEYLLLND